MQSPLLPGEVAELRRLRRRRHPALRGLGLAVLVVLLALWLIGRFA